MHKTLVLIVTLLVTGLMLSSCIGGGSSPASQSNQGSQLELESVEAESQVSQAQDDKAAAETALREMDTALNQADQEIPDDLADEDLGL